MATHSPKAVVRSQVSTPKSGHPPKLSSGVFPITSQLLRSVADSFAVCWRRSPAGTRAGEIVPLTRWPVKRQKNRCTRCSHRLGQIRRFEVLLQTPEAVSASFGLSLLVSPAARPAKHLARSLYPVRLESQGLGLICFGSIWKLVAGAERLPTLRLTLLYHGRVSAA
jgi:hypothetical protein